MDTQTTWYLVGDASRARIFTLRPADKNLQLVREFYHPESRLANRELVSDRPGRTQQSTNLSRGNTGAGPSRGNSAMEPHTSPKTVEHATFAHELADALHQGLVDHSYQNLVLVAGPQFLGLLRNVLDGQVQKHVTASLDKDYTQLSAADIEKHLTAQLDGFFLVANRASA